jgi:phosphatidylglycerophosphate synthase
MSKFRWLPNALSATRGVLALPICLVALRGAWTLGFWLIVVALFTDFLDGLAAKKLHAESTLGGHIDRVSDFLLCVGGGFGLVIGAQVLTLQLLWGIVPLSLFIGYTKFFLPEDHLLRRVVAIFSLMLLFVCWSLIVWGYLWKAFGWSWWYPALTLVAILVAARLKKHRLKAWFGWLFSNQARP